MNRALETADLKSDDFKTLRKALGYTLSVGIVALPAPAFAFLAELAQSSDRDLRWIVKQNLKKNRLVKQFPDQVAFCQRLLES